MYRKLRVAVVVPAYNEEKLIEKTVTTVPDFVDLVIAVNDASKDNTLGVLRKLKKSVKRLHVIDNQKNGGVGFSIKAGLKHAQEQDMDLVAIMAGDAQMDPAYLNQMIDDLIERDLDFIKANRFMHIDALKHMPTYRRVGNIVVTILTKFATGYYSIFDTQNGYVVYTKKSIENLPFNLLSNRYDYENTVLVGLSIADARIGDFPVPAIYGDEKSTINLLPTVLNTIHSLHKGFWRRIYYKYIIYNFHPVALFLISGLALLVFGMLVSGYLLFDKFVYNMTPTSGSVMLAVLPIIVGFQMLMSALIMDVNGEK